MHRFIGFSFLLIRRVCLPGLLLATAPGCNTPNKQKGTFMAEDQVQLKEVTTLIKLARTYPASALPDETHQSFPIPVRGPGGLRVEFLYCTSMVTPRVGLQIMPPSYVAFLDARTGRFEEMKAVTPADFGRRDPANQFLGVYGMAVSLTPDEFVARRDQLYHHYDVLMPLFAAGQTRVSPETQRVADEFRQLFLLITEEPLEPYYSKAGEDFFRWLDGIIR